MPIYDQVYRRYEARAPLRTLRSWPITREALRLVLTRRAFLLLLMGAWLPFVGFVIYVYGITQIPQMRAIAPLGGPLFMRFFDWQLPLCLLLTVFGGAGLIANDLRTGAILVYLSRPLTRRDYVLGKLGVLLALNLAVTLAPGLLLYATAVSLLPEQFLTWQLAWLGPAIVLQSLLISSSLSLLALAVSALSRSARVAGLGFFGLFAGLEMVRGVLVNVYDRREAALLSLQSNLRVIGNALFGVATRGFEVHWAWAAAVVIGVGLGCVAVLRARVRAVEIVR